MLRGRLHLLASLCGVAACLREDLPAESSAPAPPAPPSAAIAASSSASLPPAPLPRPYRGRLAAASTLNATCESCHDQEASEWRRSRHRQANTNAAYVAAFAAEPQPFCRGCHAPESDPNEAPPKAISEIGVACVTCHVTEDGVVLAAARSGDDPGDAPHPLRRSAELAQSGACAGCHEFRFPMAPSGEDDALFMQTTLREHARSPAAEKACATCHMPLVQGRRSHAFAEVRDPAWLRQNLQVKAERLDGGRLRVTLVQPAPGHGFPTGDLFRRLEIGGELRDEAGKTRRREVRHLARHFEIVPGRPGRTLTHDDRVFDEPSVVEMDLSAASPPRSGVVRWWVTYQRVATAGVGDDPAGAKIESEIPLHSGVIPWKSE